MKIAYDELKSRGAIVIWGTGKSMKDNIEKIDPLLKLVGFCDSDKNKWGLLLHKGLVCRPKDDISPKDAVIIAIQKEKDIEVVSKELDFKGIDYCYIYEAVDAYKEDWEKTEIRRLEKCSPFEAVKELDKNKIVKYITCHVPYTFCNLQCNYCYVRQLKSFRQVKMRLHSPKFIRLALSRKRLGGTCFIVFCGEGETMLPFEILPIIEELVNEGHYIHLVTNGTITGAFDELLTYNIDLSHIFIKFSFHYAELVRRGLLDVFSTNIRRMRKAGCSISVELVASDDLLPYIEDIKEWSMRHIGALPHLTIPRDETDKDLKVITELDMEEYKKIWGQFESRMFQFKYDNLYVQRYETCMAGEWSFLMDLETGGIFKCNGNPYLDNIYNDICKEIHLEAVKDKCCLPYCFNCHSYLAFGLVEGMDAPTYYEVRDRKTVDGGHWITDELKPIISQKLYINNSGR